MDEKINIDKVECILRKHLVTVKLSYHIKYEDVEKFCSKLKAATGERYKRSARSWQKEIIAHNMLFNAGLFDDHVADTDLEEKESIHRLLGYDFLYFLYKIAKHFKKSSGEGE